MAEGAKWYVIHTYSGYEKKVEANIHKMIENRGMQEQITDIRVPEEEDTESSRSGALRKIFPGYVFLKMIMSDDAWHAVKSIHGVTGFVGADSKPEPLADSEIVSMRLKPLPTDKGYAIGDSVRIIDGAMKGYIGKITEISAAKNKVKLSVDLFMGRETEVDLELTQIEEIV